MQRGSGSSMADAAEGALVVVKTALQAVAAAVASVAANDWVMAAAGVACSSLNQGDGDERHYALSRCWKTPMLAPSQGCQ
jgi:hypothetical protein